MTPYLLNEEKTHNLKRLTCHANAVGIYLPVPLLAALLTSLD